MLVEENKETRNGCWCRGGGLQACSREVSSRKTGGFEQNPTKLTKGKKDD